MRYPATGPVAGTGAPGRVLRVLKFTAIVVSVIAAVLVLTVCSVFVAVFFIVHNLDRPQRGGSPLEGVSSLSGKYLCVWCSEKIDYITPYVFGVRVRIEREWTAPEAPGCCLVCSSKLNEFETRAISLRDEGALSAVELLVLRERYSTASEFEVLLGTTRIEMARVDPVVREIAEQLSADGWTSSSKELLQLSGLLARD